MLKMINRTGQDFEAIRTKYLPSIKDGLLRFPFDSTRKRMSTVLVYPDEEAPQLEHGYNKRLHVKGASEIIIETCDSYIDSNGNKVPLDDGKKSEIFAQISTYANMALRTIGFAYKDLKKDEGGPNHEECEEG